MLGGLGSSVLAAFAGVIAAISIAGDSICLAARFMAATDPGTGGRAGTHLGVSPLLACIAISMLHFNCWAHAVIVVPTVPV